MNQKVVQLSLPSFGDATCPYGRAKARPFQTEVKGLIRKRNRDQVSKVEIGLVVAIILISLLAVHHLLHK